MTTPIDTRHASAAFRPSRPLARIVAIARAEAKLLGRNRATLVTGLLMGPLMAGLLALFNLDGDATGGTYATFVICMLVTWSVLMAVYYNLTSIFVARREERVFKRMSTGEASGWEALIAASVPSTLILGLQVVLGAAIAVAVFGVPDLTNPLLAVLGLAGAVVVCVALAAASTAFTSSVESAQYSTMPVFVVLVFFSGTNFPLAAMPEAMQAVSAATPLNAASELISLGLNGTDLLGDATAGLWSSFVDAGRPLLVLTVWIAGSIWLARRHMRFEPRR